MATDWLVSAAAYGGSYDKPISGVLHHRLGHDPYGIAKGLWMEPYLVPGRVCGTCIVCCVALWIDDPQLRKAAGDPCGHLTSERTCAIYEARPQTCRLFHCGWRQLRWIDDHMRPDESGVLIRVQTATHGLQAGLCLGVSFLVLDPSALESEKVARAVAATVATGVPVTLAVAGPRGQAAAQVRVDEALQAAVWTRDDAAILAVLKQVHAQAVASNGTAADHDIGDDATHLGHAPDVC